MSDIIDIGNLPNDGTGDPLRVAFDKINQNFAALATLVPTGPEGSLQFKTGDVFEGTANLVYDSANNTVLLGGNVLPLTDSTVSIGSPDLRIDKIYLDQTGLSLGNISIQESGNVISFPVSVFPSVKASLAVNNITTDGNVTVGGSLEFANSSMDAFSITTTTDSLNQEIFSVPASQFNTGTFHITSRESGSNNSQTVTMVVTKRNNGTSASFTAFGTVFIGTPVTRYNADWGFGNIRVMVSPILNSTITHTVSYTIDK